MDKKSRTVLFSISSNALLLAVKLAAGVLTGSVSVLSEAVHSATDLVASIVAFVAVRGSISPPDESHHYGHGRFENLASIFEGVILLGVGGWVIFEAARHILNGTQLELLGLGIVVMAFSAVVNLFVSRWLLKVARETDSRALEAEGYNLRTDIWGAGGVALERVIEGGVKSDPSIQGFHKLRARKSGPQRHVDFHLQLKAETTLGEAHKISDGLEERIRHNLPNSDVLIHLEDDRSITEDKPASKTHAR